jgi:hypothetical protein
VKQTIGILYSKKQHNIATAHVIDRENQNRTEYHYYTVCGLKKHKLDMAYNFEYNVVKIFEIINDSETQVCEQCAQSDNSNVKFLKKFFRRR